MVQQHGPGRRSASARANRSPGLLLKPHEPALVLTRDIEAGGELSAPRHCAVDYEPYTWERAQTGS